MKKECLAVSKTNSIIVNLFKLTDEEDLGKLGLIGIAITRINDTQHHIGILLKDNSFGTIRFLHLAWHLILEFDEIHSSNFNPTNYLFTIPNLPKGRDAQLVAACKKIWKKNNDDGIPYGFNEPKFSFDEATGAFLFGETKLGLTCSTFILAVFEHVGVNLINYQTWKDRPDDDEWRIATAKRIEQRYPEHAQLILNSPHAPRYRPPDVTVAAALFPPPLIFNQAVEHGNQVIMQLNNLVDNQ